MDQTGTPHDEEPTGELERIDLPVADPSVDATSEHPEQALDEHLQQEPRGGLTMVVAQGVLGAVVLFFVAADPFAFTALEELVGFGIVTFGLFEVVSAIRRRYHVLHLIQAIAAIAAGVVLIFWPDQTLTISGYALGAVITVRGVMDAWAGARRWFDAGANAWVFVRGVTLIAIGALVILFPAQSVTLVVVGGALLAIGRATISTWFVLSNADAASRIDAADTYGIITYWLSRREMDSASAEQVEDRVFLQRGNARDRFWRFAVLMGLATGIATFGIATDSTAVVIGAMLVAPLMTPILGVAAGLINGRTRSTLISAATVLLGALGAIALAWMLAAAIPDLQAVVNNGEVTSRTAPSILDLAIAIFAGAAGAYGVSRPESSDALPGVAVAIALVPPLSVAGITLHAEDFGQAVGALLLFLTNLFSILLMAGAVFVLVGYGSWSRLYHRRNRIRVSFAAVVLAIVLVTIPLALTGQRILRSSADLRHSSAAVEQWLGADTDLRTETIEVDGDLVTVELVGPTVPPASAELAEEVSERVGRTMAVIVRWVEEQRFTSGDATG
jgi:uncharacterized hydrophobic protein (TIGR00271 family)